MHLHTYSSCVNLKFCKNNSSCELLQMNIEVLLTLMCTLITCITLTVNINVSFLYVM